MLTSDPLVVSADMLDAAKAFLRIDGNTDDAALTTLVGAAVAHAEAFTCSAIFERGFVETIDATGAWRSLTAWRAVAIDAVTAIDGQVLPAGTAEIDIDMHGNGRVRLTLGPPKRLRVAYRAGMAVEWPQVPEPVRHGIVGLVALLHAARDGAGAPDVAATLASLRAHRRIKLS